MKAPITGAAVPAEPGENTPPATLAEWQRLRFPSEEEWIRISEQYPERFGQGYYELDPWLRLGWPDADLYGRVVKAGAKLCGRAVSTMQWSKLQDLYPDRPGVAERDQDLARLARLWPDCFGQAIVDVELVLVDGITINTVTYGPGKHRVPASVAGDLRHIDNTARQHFIDQFIPRKHQTKVLATLSMTGGGGAGEVTE